MSVALLGALAGLLLLVSLRGPAAELSLASLGGDEAAGEVGVERVYGELPLSFEPNAGRMDRRVDFVARTAAGSAYLTGAGATLALAGERGGRAVDLRLVGADSVEPVGLGRLPGSVNDLRGDDPGRWETGIATFERIRYRGVYPGVDLDWRGSAARLEYDFRLAPGADPGQVALRVGRADRLRLARDGDLLIGLGRRTLRQGAPIAYQPPVGGGDRTPVQARFELRGNTVRFGLGAYDRGRPLVIDPVVLDYSSYLGGNGADAANAIAVDSTGAAYVTGRTLSTDFDTAAPVEGDGGDADVFVSKLTPAGDALAYSTYLGGSRDDWGAGIAVGAGGAAYVIGTTASSDFNTVGPIQTDPAPPTGPVPGDATDAFVAKLTPAGDALAYSTYLGSASSAFDARENSRFAYTEGAAIAVDSTGAAYVTGSTDGSGDFPSTLFSPPFTPRNSIEECTAERRPNGRTGRAEHSEISDAFVAKLNPAGSGLVYASCLGGTSGDGGTAIAVDSAGAAYVAGATSSSDFDTTAGSYEGDSGGYDGFVFKLTPAPDASTPPALAYSTYLGGADFDAATAIAVDSSGAAYVAGSTSSSDFPTASPIEGDSPGPDAFVAKLALGGGALEYSTYLGGDRADHANAIALDGGAAYVAGETESTDFDTAGELEGDSAGSDAFVTRLAPSGSLGCSTYLGGDGADRALGIAAGAGGSAYVAGSTSSSDFDTKAPIEGDSPGPDAFAAKLSLSAPCAPSPKPAAAGAERGLRVYAISLDGLRPQEVTPALTPQLDQLKQTGTWYEQARSVFIAETLPNHAAMMTGVLPERSAIIGNDYKVGGGGTKVKMQEPRMFESETLTTSLERSCDVSTATVQSKQYLYWLFGGEPPAPDAPTEARQADYHWNPMSSGAYIGEPDDHAPDAATMTEGLLPWVRSNPPAPQFAFVNLGDIDRSGHVDESGAITAGGLSAFRQAALADTDTQVGLLVDELKRSGAWDETVLIFTSDHGFDWSVPQNTIDFARLLEEGGFNIPEDPDDDVRGFQGAGGAMMVYLRRPGDTARTRALVDYLEAHPGIEFAATRRRLPGLDRPTLAEMGLDHRYTGDVVAFLEPGWRVFDDNNFAIPGNHAQPVTQHQSLFVAGGHPVLDETPESVGGEKAYDPTRSKLFSPPAGGPGNLSIAPTVAALFGLGEPPGGYDGEPLREAFDARALEPHAPCGANPSAIPRLSIGDVSVSEGNSGTADANFTVSLSAASQSAVKVDYRTSDGTAVAPDDYESRGPATLSFAAGQTEQTLSVPVNGDTVDEPDETFTVDLSAPAGAELAKARGTATITDDDPTPGGGGGTGGGGTGGGGTGGGGTGGGGTGGGGTGGSGTGSAPRRCLARRAPVGPRNIGRIALGRTRAQLRRRVTPVGRTRHALRWCVRGSRRRVTAVFSSRSRRGRVRLVITRAPAHGNRGVRPGSSARRLLRAYPGAARVRRGAPRGLVRAGGRTRYLFGVRRGRVRFIAVADRRLLRQPRTLRRYVRRARRTSRRAPASSTSRGRSSAFGVSTNGRWSLAFSTYTSAGW